MLVCLGSMNLAQYRMLQFTVTLNTQKFFVPILHLPITCWKYKTTRSCSPLKPQSEYRIWPLCIKTIVLVYKTLHGISIFKQVASRNEIFIVQLKPKTKRNNPDYYNNIDFCLDTEISLLYSITLKYR